MSTCPAKIFIVIIALILSLCGCSNSETATKTSKTRTTAAKKQPQKADLPPFGQPQVGKKPPMPNPVRVPSPEGYRVETFVSGLIIPWDMAFASKNRIYVTERPGRVRLIQNGKLLQKPYAIISSAASGEGGLMGIALHPDYPNPHQVYLMYTYRSNGRAYNRVSRFDDTGSGLKNERAIITKIPGAMYHDGGIIRFGPDGMLYIGTGDAKDPDLAQDRSSLAGKILRVNPDGGVPKDNPFPDSKVYAMGLRNVEGLAWNPDTGDLWVTNHGPSGEFSLEAKDSAYIVKPGSNCGWPRVLGVVNRRGVEDPVLFFPDSAVPPGSAVFYKGSLMPQLKGNFMFTSLRGEHLQRVVLDGDRKVSRIELWFSTGTYEGRYGRLRGLVEGPDGALYVTTSNRDGRGDVRRGDDRILRITPHK